MTTLPRDEEGLFALKSGIKRLVKSIRVTEWLWDEFGFLATQRRMTRADLLEVWIKEHATPTPGPTPIELAIAVQHLNQALTMKANAGGAIKAEIKEALRILES